VPLFYIDKRGCEEDVDDLKCPDTLDEMLLIVRQVRSALPVSRHAAAHPSARMASSRTDSADDANDDETGSNHPLTSSRADPDGDDFEAAAAHAASHPKRKRPVMQACSSYSSTAHQASNEHLSLPDYRSKK
jgi:hypothetical protein